MYSLYKEDNSVGDSGTMSMTLWEESEELEFEHDAKPRVGVAIRVGSHRARTMENQDWWQTSYIEKILEEKEYIKNNRKVTEVKFKTQNSIYIWKMIE